jgi:predicted acyltransferase
LFGEVPTFDRAPNNWANYIDVQVFGSHNYKADYDPEGLLSTLPSIASSLLGIFTGLILISKKAKKEMLLFGLGVIMLLVGYLWDISFPINKAIWSSSFVLVTAGWANIFLALIYFLTDVKGIQFGSIFRYMGSNAITLYFLSSFISKLFYSINVREGMSIHEWLFETIFRHDFLSGTMSSLLYGLSVVGFYLLLGLFMYRKRIFIKV